MKIVIWDVMGEVCWLEGMFVLADFSHLSMIGIMSNLGNMDRNSGSNLRHIDRKLSNRCH